MKYAILNNFAQVLAGSLPASTVDAEETLTLNGGGARLDAVVVPSEVHALLTLIQLNADKEEIAWEVVEVIGVEGNELTVLRGQDDTEAVAWDSGAPVEMRVTTKLLQSFVTAEDLPEPPDLDAYYRPATDPAVFGAGAETMKTGLAEANSLPAAIVIRSQAGSAGIDVGAEDEGEPLVYIDANDSFNWIPGRAVSVGVNNWPGPNGLALGWDNYPTGDEFCMAIGRGNYADWDQTMAVGQYQYAYDFSVSVGMGFQPYDGGSRETGGSYYELCTSIGFVTEVNGDWGIGLGARADVYADHGFRITAIPYIPEPYRSGAFNVEEIGGDPNPWYTQPNCTKHSSMQIALALPPINLSDAAGTQFDLQLGGDLVLFVDSIEMVVRKAGTIAGAPEISIGTSAGTTDNVLAPTVIGDLTQYSRQVEQPLIASGVTNLVAEITTPGTGSGGELYVVIKGFAVEAA